MKNLLTGYAIIGCLLSLNSCTKVLYSHEKVMQSYATKAAVVKQFGIADEAITNDKSEQWLYNCDTAINLKPVFGNSNTHVAVNGTYNNAVGIVKATPSEVARFTPYNRYVTFTFERQGNVLKWESHGVDFAQRKSDKLKTGLLIGGVSVGIVVTALIFLARGASHIPTSFGY